MSSKYAYQKRKMVVLLSGLHLLFAWASRHDDRHSPRLSKKQSLCDLTYLHMRVHGHPIIHFHQLLPRPMKANHVAPMVAEGGIQRPKMRHVLRKRWRLTHSYMINISTVPISSVPAGVCVT